MKPACICSEVVFLRPTQESGPVYRLLSRAICRPDGCRKTARVAIAGPFEGKPPISLVVRAFCNLVLWAIPPSLTGQDFFYISGSGE